LDEYRVWDPTQTSELTIAEHDGQQVTLLTLREIQAHLYGGEFFVGVCECNGNDPDPWIQWGGEDFVVCPVCGDIIVMTKMSGLTPKMERKVWNYLGLM
jgi:hypothetical protein